MSLIGDALRKARQEAAERDSERRGVLFSAKISDAPSRSNLGLGLALGAAIAVIATVAGGGAVWWLVGRTDGAADRSPGIAAPATGETALAVQTPTPSPVSDEPAAAPGEPPPPATEIDRGTREPAVATGLEEAPPTADAGVATTPGADPTESESEVTGGFIGVEDGAEVYVMEAAVGKVRLSLDYLVFRQEDPFVEINGVELHLGGTIEGFRVKAIERDRVQLSDGRRTIVLRAP